MVAVSTPWPTLTVVLRASVGLACEVSVASPTVIAVTPLNVSVPSSSTVCTPGTVFTGASLTAATVRLITFVSVLPSSSVIVTVKLSVPL